MEKVPGNAMPQKEKVSVKQDEPPSVHHDEKGPVQEDEKLSILDDESKLEPEPSSEIQIKEKIPEGLGIIEKTDNFRDPYQKVTKNEQLLGGNNCYAYGDKSVVLKRGNSREDEPKIEKDQSYLK